MIHYSCDRCKREIDSQHDLRYVVRIEIEAATDVEQAAEFENDHLVVLDEMLENTDLFESDPLGGATHATQRYDLCIHCYKHFCKNPLGRETSAGVQA